MREAHRVVLTALRALEPDGWRSFTPRLASLASWVGYDFDGRSDIHWSDTLRFRLVEKSLQLRRYEAAARDIQQTHDVGEGTALAEFGALAGQGAAATEEHAALFAAARDDLNATVEAANALTGEGDPRLTLSGAARRFDR